MYPRPFLRIQNWNLQNFFYKPEVFFSNINFRIRNNCSTMSLYLLIQKLPEPALFWRNFFLKWYYYVQSCISFFIFFLLHYRLDILFWKYMILKRKYMKSYKSQKSYILKMWLWRIKRNLPKNTVFVARSVLTIKTEGMNNLKW